MMYDMMNIVVVRRDMVMLVKSIQPHYYLYRRYDMTRLEWYKNEYHYQIGEGRDCVETVFGLSLKAMLEDDDIFDEVMDWLIDRLGEKK